MSADMNLPQATGGLWGSSMGRAADIDTYFMIKCFNGEAVPKHGGWEPTKPVAISDAVIAPASLPI